MVVLHPLALGRTGHTLAVEHLGLRWVFGSRPGHKVVEREDFPMGSIAQ